MNSIDADESFDRSFDVSHISHVSSSDDEDGMRMNPTEFDDDNDDSSQPLPPLPASTSSSHYHQHDRHSHENNTIAPSVAHDSLQPQTAPSSSWFSSPDSTYDEFITRHSNLPSSQSHSLRPLSNYSPPRETLESERHKLRQRKSGQFHSDGEPTDSLPLPISPPPPAAAAAVAVVAPAPSPSQFPESFAPWTHADDALLRAAVSVHGELDWISVGAAFRGARSKKQCFERWTQVLQPYQPSHQYPPTDTSAHAPTDQSQRTQPPSLSSFHPSPPSMISQSSSSSSLLSSSSLSSRPIISRDLPHHSSASPIAEQSPPPNTAAPSMPVIPKLSFNNLFKPVDSLDSATPPSSAVSASVTGRPSTSSGASTTRSRLTLFNAKLRAARRIQHWYRTHLACRSARSELARRRAELESRAIRARGFRPGAERPIGKRLQFEEIDTPTPEPTNDAAQASRRQRGLKGLKEKLRASVVAGSPSSNGRPRTAATTTTTANTGASSGSMTSRARSNSNSTHASPARVRARSAHGVRASIVRSPARGTTNSSSSSSSPFASPVKRREAAASAAVRQFRPFPLHAVPALRALLQGFLVRHQLRHSKPVRDLVQQIRDVTVMVKQVERERADASSRQDEQSREQVRYAAYFGKTLQQQLTVLKAQLWNALHSNTYPSSSNASSSSLTTFSPSRVHFPSSHANVSASPDDSTNSSVGGGVGGGGGGAISTHRSSIEPLKRTSQRRFLKKGARDRPQTAAPTTNTRREHDIEPTSIGERDAHDTSVSGSSTSRTFLKRRSQKQPSHKLDWSRVSSKVDAKLDNYRAPSNNALFDAATGKEYMPDRPHTSGGHLPHNSPTPAPATARVSQDRSRKVGSVSVSNSSGSQTARESVSQKKKRAFRPSGHVAQPVLANTDSAAPPLSPNARPSTAHAHQRKSRHIKLEPRPMDLSKVTSKVDYRSPYKPIDSPDSDHSFDYDSVLLGVQPASTRSPISPYRMPRSYVTASRADLQRLDEELARERAEQASLEDAWNRHGVQSNGEGGFVSNVSDTRLPMAQRTTRLQNTPQRERASSDPEANLSAAHYDEEDEVENDTMQSLSAQVSPVQSPRDYTQSSVDQSYGMNQSYTNVDPDASVLNTSSARLSAQELLINAEIEDIERSLKEMSAFAESRKSFYTRDTRPVAQPLNSEWKRVINIEEEPSATPIPIIDQAYAPYSQSSAGNGSFVTGGSTDQTAQSPTYSNHTSSRNKNTAQPISGSSSQGVFQLTLQFDELSKEFDRLSESFSRR